MAKSIADIVLIGPVRAGKSTQGRLLAQRLDLPQVSVDKLRWKYHQEIGYDETLAKEFRARGGFLALYLYWNLFDAYTIERRDLCGDSGVGRPGQNCLDINPGCA
jgi:adenylate kinase family enzyme